MVKKPNQKDPASLILTYGADIIAFEGQLKPSNKAKSLKSKSSNFTGSVRFQGSALAKVNGWVELDGLGKSYKGKKLISGLQHHLENGHWETKLILNLPTSFFSEKAELKKPPTEKYLPAIHGLHLATVNKIDADPKGMQRIQVILKNASKEEQKIWARMIQSYATRDAGAFVYPEIKDEVLLGYLNNDPRFPVILGVLYSKTQQPTYTPNEKNTVKAFVSREKIKVEINEEDKSLNIQTPGKQFFKLSDADKLIEVKDMNGNHIQLSEKGITLHSSKDITFKAKGNINFAADGKIEGKAKADINLDGLNIKAKAKVGLEASGNASAKLTASGQLTIKGAMVMIN